MINSKLNAERQLLQAMIRIRMIEEAIANRYPDEKMRCPVHLSIGQEAPSAAFAMAVRAGDYAVSTHRAHAHFLAMGGSLQALIAELHGKTTGCSRGAGGSMHLADRKIGFMGSSAIVGNSIPIGVGLAFSQKLRREGGVSWVFLGDAATEEGVYYESMNFAVLKELPVIFMCENNGYSVYTDASVRRPPSQTISSVARSLGADAKEIDGNSALECLEAVFWARERALNGPVLLEFSTFRQREHCGPNFDDSLGYRPKSYVQAGLSSDPINSLIRSRESSHASNWLDEFKVSVGIEIEEAFNLAEQANYLTLEEAASLVYAD